MNRWSELIRPIDLAKDVAIEGVLKDKILSAKVLRKRAHEYVPAKFDRKKEAETAEAEANGEETKKEEKADGGLSLDQTPK